MKRVGLIDNLSQVDDFLANRHHVASAEEVMVATGGNTGNVAFVYGARKIIGDSVARVDWASSAQDVRERFDHLVICCANQIGKHADLGAWADRLEHFSLPVTLLGLGAQADSFSDQPEIPEGTRRFLAKANEMRFDRSAPNIAVRGNFTQKVLEDAGTVSVPAGCPSLHISQRQELGANVLANQRLDRFAKVAVAAGNPWHGPSAALEKTLVVVVDEYRGDYILQHPLSMLQIASGEQHLVGPATVRRFLEVYGDVFDASQMFDWYRKNGLWFVDAPNWMRYLRRFDLVLGPRYHGVALAVQVGVPGCVVTIDSRTQELCDGTGMKHLELNQALERNADELVEMSRWNKDDATSFDANRLAKGLIWVDFLKANGLTPSDHLKGLVA